MTAKDNKKKKKEENRNMNEHDTDKQDISIEEQAEEKNVSPEKTEEKENISVPESEISVEEFSKLKQLAEKYEKENMDYRDKLIRKIAEFENYKKRTSDEFLRLISTANEDLILKILPVIDDLERFQHNFNAETKAADMQKGIDLIIGKFNTITTNLGLQVIEAVGQEFDPNFHEALMQMESKDVESNHVIDQHEKGYLLKDKVIRHSKVLVAK